MMDQYPRIFSSACVRNKNKYIPRHWLNAFYKSGTMREDELVPITVSFRGLRSSGRNQYKQAKGMHDSLLEDRDRVLLISTLYDILNG